MKNNILFVIDKWTDHNPNNGLTFFHDKLFATFKQNYSSEQMNIVHYDEVHLEHATHIDKILEKICKKLKPTVMIVGIHAALPPNIPSMDVLKKCKEHIDKMCFVWPDLNNQQFYSNVERYNNVADLHIALAYEKTFVADKLLWLWSPENPKLYFPLEESKKDIPISFIGSVRYGDRQQYLSHVVENKIPIVVQGGQRENFLSPEQYANLIRRSKITINFSSSPGSDHQVKGRVFEALASNTLLLESANEKTRQLLIPGKHYVEFTTPLDLVQKIDYFSRNDAERIKIANEGYEEYKKKYTATEFWKLLFDKLKVDMVNNNE